MRRDRANKVWCISYHIGLLFALTASCCVCTAPQLLLNDPVYDHTLKRVGVEISGDEEPHFLWDGTAYMSEAEKPPTFSDGKIRLPEAPRLYLE